MEKITFEKLKEYSNNKSFNLVYSKVGRTPKNICLENKDDVLNFIQNNIYDINLLFINDIYINIGELKKNNVR